MAYQKVTTLEEDGISQADQADGQGIDRRSIPVDAVETRWRAADGHALRRIDWPGSGKRSRGSILFFPGRGDNYEKYLETLEEWHRAGWRVTAADWRGQAGSGRLGMDETTGHVADFSVWLNDLEAFWRDWQKETPAPHVLAGHSMGGHLTMRSVVDAQVSPNALVLSAPMLGMAGPPLPLPLLHTVARLMTRIGAPTRPAWKWSEKPGEMPAGRQDLLTHDDARYQDELWWRRERPELVMGPGSWGWVERAYASTRALFSPDRLEAVRTPVLILATSNDKLVSHDAITRACKRLPDCELVDFGIEAHHEILRESDAVRVRAMRTIADFLDRKAPAASS